MSYNLSNYRIFVKMKRIKKGKYTAIQRATESSRTKETRREMNCVRADIDENKKGQKKIY